MISRITIFSLLLALMLGLGIYMHSQGEHDRCSTYPAGGVPPRSEYVVTGERQVEMPCRGWWLRQSLTVQILCMLDATLGALFAVHAAGDLAGWLRWRRARKGLKNAPIE